MDIVKRTQEFRAITLEEKVYRYSDEQALVTGRNANGAFIKEHQTGALFPWLEKAWGCG